MDEFARIALLQKRFARATARPDLALGIGDDAAVLAPSTRAQVLSVDAAVEGVHFRWGFGSPTLLAKRAATAALSDLAAMGAEGRTMLIAMTLADDVDDARFEALIEGYALASEDYGISVAGGNLARAATTTLTTTVVGELDGAAVERRGARPGDGVFVTGTVGGPGLGLHALLGSDESAELMPFVQQWLMPQARLDCVAMLKRDAHAAVDVSDGLIQDLTHVCHASGVDAEVDLDALPLPPGLLEVASRLGLDGQLLAAQSGDDYQLLFTAEADGPANEWASRAGSVQPSSQQFGRVWLRRQGQRLVPPERGGYRHFEGA